MIRMVNVLVERSEHLSIPRAIGAWELPVLELVHGPEKVTITKGFVYVDRELPDPQAEFERLDKRYLEESGQPWVALAYAGARGVKDLEKAIAESQEGVVEFDPTA